MFMKIKTFAQPLLSPSSMQHLLLDHLSFGFISIGTCLKTGTEHMQKEMYVTLPEVINQ